MTAPENGNLPTAAAPRSSFVAKPALHPGATLFCRAMLKLAGTWPPALFATSTVCRWLQQPYLAFEALYRILVIDPSHDRARRRLAFWLDHATLLSAFRNARWSDVALRTEMMIAALRKRHLLPGEMNVNVLPTADWPEDLAKHYWQSLNAQVTSAETTEIARQLQLYGDIDAAERLLRGRLTVAPEDQLAPLALIGLLDQVFRRDEAEQVAMDAAKLAPDNVDVNLALARVQFSRGRFKNAAATLQALLAHVPDNPRVWLDYAQVGRYSYDLPLGTEDEAFVRAADCAGADFSILETVAQYFLEQRNFAKAAEYYERFMAANPGAYDNLSIYRDYARALTGCGRMDAAAATLARGVERCRAIAATKAGDELELVMRDEARLLQMAGRADDALARLRAIRNSGAKPNYGRPEYLPSTPDRLHRLQTIVGSRDVIIFLQGPSFADFAARMNEVADLDFAAAIQGNFPPVDQELRRHFGRGADLLMVTNPQMVRSWYRELLEYLTQPEPNLLLATHYAVSNVQEQGVELQTFMAEHDDRLLFAYPAEGPPLPSRPLHFETSNSLSFFLPLIIIGRPKRIFIVGADGGGHPNFKRPYFFYDDIDAEEPEKDFLQRPDLYSYKNRPDMLEEANRRLFIDAMECDRMVLSSFQFLEHIFDIPIPPIFNICPHSTHRAFPRIDVETAIRMLRDPKLMSAPTD